jgi:plastocyanin
MRFERLGACLAALMLCVVACTNGGGLGSESSGGGTPSPLPSGAIGLGIPTGSIGVEDDPVWGTISGFTLQRTSQVLALAPGSKVKLTNLSSTNPHTLDVIAIASGPPPKFPPASASLPFTAHGNGVLGAGYASGIISPGQSVMVTLSNPGIYLIGCAFHYSFGMRDVLQVSASATPGPTASPGSGGF